MLMCLPRYRPDVRAPSGFPGQPGRRVWQGPCHDRAGFVTGLSGPGQHQRPRPCYCRLIGLAILPVGAIATILSIRAANAIAAPATVTALAASAPFSSITTLASGTAVAPITTPATVFPVHTRPAMATPWTGRRAGFAVFSRCAI
ncbi:hypothetical protein C8D72_2738 [Kushneria indalinina DSM 14324]|uniref:Uncharacterized protein n=1 Tax=Kushneria indalinina DSM 14324 TaxID=1122140 RepID=A0A3D9DUF8_9GAMM|nr:hypothetical protein C8D72_2738 [Kushneria indalinina DSM 14324]